MVCNVKDLYKIVDKRLIVLARALMFYTRINTLINSY